jgi:CheY-like chemotaxis protein
VPAIAVTAHARTDDRTRALAAGFELYVSKPVLPEDVVLAVRSAVRSDAGRPRNE